MLRTILPRSIHHKTMHARRCRTICRDSNTVIINVLVSVIAMSVIRDVSSTLLKKREPKPNEVIEPIVMDPEDNTKMKDTIKTDDDYVIDAEID